MTWANQVPTLFPGGSAESQIDRLLDDAIRTVSASPPCWDPTCNIFENSNGFTVQMALPGMEPNQIDVQVENNVLRVKGERKTELTEESRWYTRSIPEGVFSCSFTLPAYANHEKCTASYRHGILTVAFPKREEAKPHRIQIESQ